MVFIYLLITPCSLLLVIGLATAIVCCAGAKKDKAVFLLSIALLMVVILYIIAVIIDRDIFMAWVFFMLTVFDL